MTAPDSATVLNPDSRANRETVLTVAGMDCADEVAIIHDALKRLPAVANFTANVVTGKVTIRHTDVITVDALIAAIGANGLKASATAERAASGITQGQRLRIMSVVGAGVLTGIGLLQQWTQALPPPTAVMAFVGAILAGGWLVFPKAVASVRRLSLDMNVLMSVAVIGACTIDEWSEAAAVIFLFSLSELLESLSITRARRAIQALMQLAPETAWLKDGETFTEVPVERIAIGNIVSVKSGGRVPLDGEVVAGESSINQAPITGESIPVDKRIGDTVFAGTINGDGSLEIRVTKAHADTTIARIMHMVSTAQSQRAPSQRFVDVFAAYYTPLVMALAILVWVIPPLLLGGIWSAWTYRALVLLVIACPCALVISTPVSVISGLTAMAQRGVLIKGGAFLEAIGRIRALAVDKTGTITSGRLRVTQVIPLGGTSTAELIRVAAAIDAHSDHPAAHAVVSYAREQNITFRRAEQYQARSGRGAEGELDGHAFFVGNHRFAHESAVCSTALEQQLAAIEATGQSVIIVGHKPHKDCPGEVLGVLAVGDAIRPNAAAAVLALRAAGVKRVVMLSGDNQRTVDTIAKQAGLDEGLGDLLPEDKVQRVRDLMSRFHHVGMIGDGVNDAPAMAVASVGIAMGAMGSDVAIETADVALMQDDLGKVAEAVRLGRRTVRVIQANIAFALAVKAVFLVLAVLGHTSLWLAILADTGATLLVVANALRLRFR